MMKIVCPACATVVDHGGVADDLLAMMRGVGTLSVRCPNCGIDIDLPPDPDPRDTARAWGFDVDRAVAA